MISLPLRNRWFWIAYFFVVYQGCWLLFFLPPNLSYIGSSVFWNALLWRIITMPQYAISALITGALFGISLKKDQRIFPLASLSAVLSIALYLSLPDAGLEGWSWLALALMLPLNIIYIVIAGLIGIAVLLFMPKLSDAWLKRLWMLGILVTLLSLATCTVNSGWNYYSEAGGPLDVTR